MPYVVLIHATFANKSDADHIYNQAKTVATTASVARVGEAGERTSYCGVFNEDTDGTLTEDRQWQIDRFGIVRETPPIPDTEIPEWVASAGAQSAYPMTDVWGNPTRVKRLGVVYECTVAPNFWQPPGYGWVQV